MSTLKVDNIQDRTGGDLVNAKGIARAWVNFNGTGTVAIREAFNVSSITDNGTGDYTVNFTTAMPDGNYAAVMMSRDGSGGGAGMLSIRPTTAGTVATFVTTTSIRLMQVSSANASQDGNYCCIAIFR